MRLDKVGWMVAKEQQTQCWQKRSIATYRIKSGFMGNKTVLVLAGLGAEQEPSLLKFDVVRTW